MRRRLGALALCCASLQVQAAGESECVILLHGLARSADSMQDMADALTADGYRVANVSYPSRELPIEELAPLAVESGLRDCGENRHEYHFVTHSLGGILVRHYYATRSVEDVGRVVMLGPPNQGSRVADAMRDVPGFDWLNGPAGSQLGKGLDSVPLALDPPDFEFAVIAGTRSIDPLSSAFLDNPDDGRVSVKDTRLEGMRDFRAVPVSHAFIMRDGDVIRLVKRFLARGTFGVEDDGRTDGPDAGPE
ncbi:MAG: esterase/lipase family protein [Woeseiaceae bacterium]